MLRVMANDTDGYTLETAEGTRIGWVGARVIGFRGFKNETAALDAAPVMWSTLFAALRRARAIDAGKDPSAAAAEPGQGSLCVVREGAYEWIVDRGASIARLLRSTERELAVEFVLPGAVALNTTITAAQAMYAALQPCWAPDATPPPLPLATHVSLEKT
jgi:hypothetical protein